ncbi:LysR family transcriptional regulator [Salinisphaera sp. T31B1]|uniref:LysR family transcriptional regulator n=1 Tax=Salinisphaera sp. T31B1 TaxID=727963 RepID=UPI00333FFA5A
MDRINSLALFVQVADTRSFVAAGRHLALSASAVGKSVARLEKRLGVRLFHRSTRSMTLTAEGRLLLARSRRILAEAEAAEIELAQVRDAPRGRLRVSLPLMGSLVLPVLSDFMQAYPDIQLDLDFSDRMVDVIDEGFDVVLRVGRPVDSRLASRPLGEFAIRLVASPGYIERYGKPRQPSDLADHRCLHYRYPHSGKLEPWPLAEPAAVPVTMTCNNIETHPRLALDGLGIACLPDFVVRESLDRGSLRPMLPGRAGRTAMLHALRPAGRHPAPKVRVFVDYLRTQLGRVLDTGPIATG